MLEKLESVRENQHNRRYKCVVDMHNLRPRIVALSESATLAEHKGMDMLEATAPGIRFFLACLEYLAECFILNQDNPFLENTWYRDNERMVEHFLRLKASGGTAMSSPDSSLSQKSFD